MDKDYTADAPTRDAIDASTGATVLDFGTNWCGHCSAARGIVDAAVHAYPGVRHIRVEDGSGRPLGRSFAVTLWPTLVFLRDGREVSRLVRPRAAEPVHEALRAITG